MVALADVKAYLRVDHGDDDAVLEQLIAAAGAYLKSIGVDMETMPIPPTVQQIQILLVCALYDNRDEPLSPTIDRLLAPYRELGI